MTDKMKGFATGLLAGRVTGRGQAKEPVAYLYNGIRAAALPDWSEETHPYAVLRMGTEVIDDLEYHIFWLTVSSSEPFVALGANLDFRDDCEGYIWHYDTLFYDGFDRKGSSLKWTPGGSTMKVEDVIWTNFDLKTENGALYMKGTKPVPVYE